MDLFHLHCLGANEGACVNYYDQYWNSGTGPGQTAHNDYRHAGVYFRDYALPATPDDSRRHTINHEIGHVLGLRDCIEPGSNPEVACLPTSIMHDRTNATHTPLPVDITSVTAIIALVATVDGMGSAGGGDVPD
jgi:hypothetical protein